MQIWEIYVQIYNFGVSKGPFCTSCGFQLTDIMKFCPICGQEKFTVAKETSKESGDGANTSVKQGSLRSQDPTNSNLCVHSYEESKGTLYKDKYDSKNRLICGICHKEFTRDKFAEKKNGIKKWQVASVVGLIFLLICTVLSQDTYTEYGVNDFGSSSTLFDEPAQSFMRPSGINTTIGAWGIPLSDASGPRSLGDVVEDMWYYLKESSYDSDDITKDEMQIALQPGNSVHNIVHSLFVEQRIIDAVSTRLIELSR